MGSVRGELMGSEPSDAAEGRARAAGALAADPVSIVHRFEEPLERELVAVMASSLAFGSVKAFYAKIEDALDRLGPGLPAVAEDHALVERRLKGWKHRVYRDRDLGPAASQHSVPDVGPIHEPSISIGAKQAHTRWSRSPDAPPHSRHRSILPQHCRERIQLAPVGLEVLNHPLI